MTLALLAQCSTVCVAEMFHSNHKINHRMMIPFRAAQYRNIANVHIVMYISRYAYRNGLEYLNEIIRLLQQVLGRCMY